MGRYNHWWWDRMEPNHRVRHPTAICVVDSEAKIRETEGGKLHTFRLACAQIHYFRKGELVRSTPVEAFHSPEEFWRWLWGKLRKRSSIWVVAHNADYDFGLLDGFRQFHNAGWSPIFFAWNWLTWIAVLKRNQRTLKVVDTVAIFREPLSELGRRVGIPKLSIPWESNRTADWEEYCTQDVRILSAALLSYLGYVVEHNLGSLKMTVPSQAMTAFRHRFLVEPIWIHHLHRYQEMERRAYYGGRCEAFYIGEVPTSPLYYLDVQGMYATILRDEVFPTRLLGEVRKPKPKEFSQLLRRHELLAEVELRTQEPAFPLREDVVYFPTGRFTTVLPGPELRYAWEKGYIRKVHWALVYRPGRPFVDYAEYFLDERKRMEERKDRMGERIAKLMANSLYGKFGQRNPVYRIAPNSLNEPPGIDVGIEHGTGRMCLRVVWGDKVYVKEGEEPAPWTFYPIAAWCTSYGRLRLWELIQKAGRDHVYYCDTDGFICDGEALERLRAEIAPGIPGRMKVKGEYSTAEIHGLKHYTLDGVEHIGGIPSSALRIAPGTYTYDMWVRTRSRLRDGTLNGVPQLTRVVRLSSPYPKGVVGEDGWITPHHLGE